MGLSQPCKACSHDPEQNKLAVVVVPEGLTGTPSMLEEGTKGLASKAMQGFSRRCEVDLDTEAVTWTSSEHFEEAPRSRTRGVASL